MVISGVVVGLAALAAVIVVQQRRSTPPEAVLLAALDREIGGEKLKFELASQRQSDAGPDRVRIAYSARGKLKEPLYVPSSPNAVLQADLASAQRSITESDRVLSSKAGPRLREWASLGQPPADPASAVVIRPTATLGTVYRYDGSAVAYRSAEGWRVQLEGGRFLEAPPDGEPRRKFGDKTYVEGDASDVAALKSVLAARLAYAEQVRSAAQKFAGQLAAERTTRLQQFQAEFKPGTLFTGFARDTSDSQSHGITLEVTAFNTATRSVNALLRNDGGWADSRAFQGTYETDEDAEHFKLVLSTRYNQAVRSAGPFLELNTNFAVSFEVLTDGGLKGSSGSVEVTLNRVPDDQREKTIAELTRDFKALLASTSVDAVYRGAAISKQSNVSEPVLLRFTRQENEGALLQAVIESAEHPSWRRALAGTVIGNRYRSENAPVRLQAANETRVRNAPNQSVFGQWGLAMKLATDGERMDGEDDAFTYRLVRATPADLAQLKTDREARENRMLAAIRSGAAYDGTARARSGSVSRLRIRVTRVDTVARTVDAIFESREQSGIFHTMSGSYDLESGEILLGSNGQGRFNPSGRLRFPLFSTDSSFKVSLHVTSDALAGELDNYDWALEFPIRAAATPTSTDDAFPSQPGGYVRGPDGRWLPLPTNGGRPTYGATEVTRGVTGLLGALSGNAAQNTETRPDKLANLTFSGNDRPPAVSGDNVVIAYVGQIKPPATYLVRRYPEIADYPDIECAPTRTLPDGRRQADLLRIVPGLAGFRENRVAASVEKPRPGVVVLNCSAPLAPGTYAIAAGEACFELIVR
jgi:hypothetical protein